MYPPVVDLPRMAAAPEVRDLTVITFDFVSLPPRTKKTYTKKGQVLKIPRRISGNLSTRMGHMALRPRIAPGLPFSTVFVYFFR